MPVKDVDGFLNAIEQIESSGGQNFDHPTMTKGIHAGDTAIGRFGLMPNTVREIATRAQRDGTITPEMQEAAAITDSNVMKQSLEGNPEIERQFARQLATRLLNKFPDEQQAAYSWNQGHNLTPERVAKRPYKDHDYVKRFEKLRKILLAGK